MMEMLAVGRHFLFTIFGSRGPRGLFPPAVGISQPTVEYVMIDSVSCKVAWLTPFDYYRAL